jgi:sortase A
MNEHDDPGAAAPKNTAPATAPARARLSVVGVLGEVLVTIGVLVMLFLGWQLWWNDMIMANSQTSAASEASQQWIEDATKATVTATPDAATPEPTATAEPTAVPATDYGAPVTASAPAENKQFAVLYVPRFGDDYHRAIAEGTGHDVLNSNRLGIGHYVGTQMPGEVGNFAVAAHRSAFGGGMHLIDELRLGDAIYVQTADGYYTYRFRDREYVSPATIDVLNPVPNTDASATDRLITLTSCNPLYSTAERIIAYGVFESWQPTSAGPPAELKPIIDAQAQG